MLNSTDMTVVAIFKSRFLKMAPAGKENNIGPYLNLIEDASKIKHAVIYLLMVQKFQLKKIEG